MENTAVLPKNHETLVSRYRKVIRVLLKYGFEDIVAHPPFNRFIPKSDRLVPHREGHSVFSYSRPERIRLVCEELGTTFIKFAQIASNRPDLLPEDIIDELKCLQDQSEAVPWYEIKEILYKELPEDPDTLFKYIEHTPIAAASIAQAHRAAFHDGTEVILKVQRPGIAQTIEMDIMILHKLAGFLEHQFEQYRAFQPIDLVKMFEKSIRKELKFSFEASNMSRFKELFENDKRIFVPTHFPYLSTDKVICMEYVNGYKITDFEAIEKIGLNGPGLVRTGINLYFKQIFEFGFFHADPHPGNFLVLPTGQICFLDFGMMGTVIDSDKELLADLLLAVHDQDLHYLINTLEKFSAEERIENIKDLEYDIMEFFNDYANQKMLNIDTNEVIRALNSLFFDYKIRIPSNLLLLLKALVMIEGVGLQVDPKYDILENAEYYMGKLFRSKYSIPKFKKGLIRTLGDVTKLATNLPLDLEEILHKLREGRLHLEFEHKGLDPLYQKLEIVSNRISFTLVLVALILGSSIVVFAKIPPFVFNISLLGFIGYIFCLFFALRLMISITKHGKF
jgi:ubiquinone biosynthesis protein